MGRNRRFGTRSIQPRRLGSTVSRRSTLWQALLSSPPDGADRSLGPVQAARWTGSSSRRHPMNLIVAKETAEGETRVALVPETVRKLSAAGLTVLVERGAGERASFPDDAFAAAGATIVASVAEQVLDVRLL